MSGGRHLRVVRDEDVPAELERLAWIKAAEGVQVVEDGPTCRGGMGVTRGPGGEELPSGGFRLHCRLSEGHKGHCLDATDIGFVPDVKTRSGRMKTRGRVVDWDGADWEDVLRLEAELSRGWERL